MKQSALNEKEMMQWYDKHHASYFTPNVKKTMKQVERKKVPFDRLPKNIRYGDQSREPIVRSFFKNSHEIALHSDGILTCDCQGWIYKRKGSDRECVHVREVYGELAGKSIPEKTSKEQRVKVQIAELILDLLED